MLRANVGDCVCRCPWIPWVPWQSAHTGASGLSLAASCPCVLRRYVSTTSAWHTEQSTLVTTVLHGRTSEAVTPVWHCAHATLAWRDPSSCASFTNIDLPLADFRSCLAWQLRQSRLAMPAV